MKEITGKVRIKTWEEMAKEYIPNRHGSIKVGSHSFTNGMEERFPENRVIIVKSNIWNGWIFTHGMIAEYINEDEDKYITAEWPKTKDDWWKGIDKPADDRVRNAAPEMLEALIDEWFFIEHFLACFADSIDLSKYDDFLQRQHYIERVVQKATGKTWEEIKEIIQ